MTFVPATEASLKRAMRDPRSWQSGHPERSAYSAWVSDGWQALGKASPGGRTAEGLVFVRAYDRTRNGHAEHVSAHTRSAPPGRVVEDMPGTTPGVAAHRNFSSGYEQHAMLNMDPVSGILRNPDRMLGAGVGGGRIMRPPLPVLRPTVRPNGRPAPAFARAAAWGHEAGTTRFRNSRARRRQPVRSGVRRPLRSRCCPHRRRSRIWRHRRRECRAGAGAGTRPPSIRRNTNEAAGRPSVTPTSRHYDPALGSPIRTSQG